MGKLKSRLKPLDKHQIKLYLFNTQMPPPYYGMGVLYTRAPSSITGLWSNSVE